MHHIDRRTNAFKSHASSKPRRENVKKRRRIEKLAVEANEKGEPVPPPPPPLPMFLLNKGLQNGTVALTSL